ncbi:MAG: dihydrofolate reductase [Patescibacteria group bacterium]
MKFSIIAACDKEMGIGKGGTLPWRLPKELEHFHAVTTTTQDASKRNAVVMGRKTWESIPASRRPLQGRLNCVITRDANYSLPAGVVRFGSLEECLEYLEQLRPPQAPPSQGGDTRLSPPYEGGGGEVERAFIIGGGELFKHAITMPACSTIYLTEIDGIFGCDTFFPTIPQDCFQEIERSDLHEEHGIRYQFVHYERKT